MKKLVSLILISILFTIGALSFVQISGKAENPSSKPISIGKYDMANNGKYKLLKRITINSDGTFQDTLHIVEGYYLMDNEKDYSEIYLQKDAKLKATFDDTDFLNTLKFSGDLSKINNYLLNKRLSDKEHFYDNYKTIFGMDQDQYLKTIKSYRNDNLKNLKNISNKQFVKLEKQKLYFDYLIKIKDFQRMHRYVTGNHKFKVSKKFLLPLTKVNLDDLNSFNKVWEYRMFLSDYLIGTLQEDDTQFDFIASKIKSIKHNAIKNFLASALLEEINSKNKNLDKVKNLALNIASDKNLKKQIEKKYNTIATLLPNSISPTFTYKDVNGNKVSLSDFKGNYVYIDVWATWCAPCKGQIPYLKKTYEEYKDKPIKFISISVDKKSDYDKWKKFVKEHDMQWYQLFADNSWRSDFIQKYMINSIPHFILLDKEGKIIDADAPRPSFPELKEKLDSLLK